MTRESPVIEIRELHKAYGPTEVLKGVSLTAPRGHVISLIGSSGSGKSTLLRCANLLEDSQSGDIHFEGEPVRWKGRDHTRRPADRAQILRIRTNLSMVFQQFNLWAHLTILENVMEAPVTVLRHPKDAVEARARDLLNKVAERFHLSARGYHRVIRVARTIADLAGSETVRKPHIAEAVSFRLATAA